MNGATYSRASFHVELHKCVRRARGDQWTINFAQTAGGRLAKQSRVTARARVNPRATVFAASPALLAATYLNTRSRKCDIIKRSHHALGPLGRYSGYALAAGHLRDTGEYTR